MVSNVILASLSRADAKSKAGVAATSKVGTGSKPPVINQSIIRGDCAVKPPCHHAANLP